MENQLKVYGTSICIDCRNLVAIMKSRGIEELFDYVDITENTTNMKAFLAIRDHAPELEEVRNMEGGGIGIPMFVRADGVITLDANEAMLWVGQPEIKDEEIVERRS